MTTNEMILTVLTTPKGECKKIHDALAQMGYYIGLVDGTRSYYVQNLETKRTVYLTKTKDCSKTWYDVRYDYSGASQCTHNSMYYSNYYNYKRLTRFDFEHYLGINRKPYCEPYNKEYVPSKYKEIKHDLVTALRNVKYHTESLNEARIRFDKAVQKATREFTSDNTWHTKQLNESNQKLLEIREKRNELRKKVA